MNMKIALLLLLAGLCASAQITDSLPRSPASIGATGNVQSAPYYASGSAQTTATSGATAAGTSVAVASAIDFTKNQGIYIAGAGGLNSVGGTITYASGGSATGSGNCWLQATNGTGGTGASAIIAVSSGVLGTITIVGSGNGYTGLPTSWTATNQTATTCSGTVVTTGGTLAASNYIGKITNVSGTTLTITPATTTSVSNGALVQHDDSAAFQAASDSMNPSGGMFFVPLGFYRLNNCNNENGAVVSLPGIQRSGSDYNNVIVSVGFTGAYQGGHLNTSSQIMSVLQTDCTSGNMFNVPVQGAITGVSFFSTIKPFFSNLLLRSYPNPSVTLLNLDFATEANVSHITVDAGGTSISATAPLSPNGIGVILPHPFNGNDVVFRDSMILGQNQAVWAGAHAYLDHVFLTFDYYGLMVGNTQDGQTDHPVFASFLDIEQSKYAIAPLGPGQNLFIDHLQYEDDGSSGPVNWIGSGAVVYDPQSYISGQITYDGTVATIVGATNMSVLLSAYWKSVSICSGSLAVSGTINSGASATFTGTCGGAKLTDSLSMNWPAAIYSVAGFAPSAAGAVLTIMPPTLTANTVTLTLENNTLSNITIGTAVAPTFRVVR